jgi:hypothetical protein
MEEIMRNLLPTNEHPFERAARIVAGGALLAVAVTGISAWGYVGVVPLLTGLLGSCPVYTLLGVSTCPLKKQTT